MANGKYTGSSINAQLKALQFSIGYAPFWKALTAIIAIDNSTPAHDMQPKLTLGAVIECCIVPLLSMLILYINLEVLGYSKLGGLPSLLVEALHLRIDVMHNSKTLYTVISFEERLSSMSKLVQVMVSFQCCSEPHSLELVIRHTKH